MFTWIKDLFFIVRKYKEDKQALHNRIDSMRLEIRNLKKKTKR